MAQSASCELVVGAIAYVAGYGVFGRGGVEYRQMSQVGLEAERLVGDLIDVVVDWTQLRTSNLEEVK